MGRLHSQRQPSIVCTAAAAALIALGGGGCGRESRPDNVLLVMSDALRAASLPTYGHVRQTAPFIDSLADRALVFTNAYSHYSYTWPSISNLFTGVPYSTLVRRELFITPESTGPGGGLVADNLTLAEILSASSVATRGVSANPWICNDHGFGQGFERLHDAKTWRPDFWEGRFHKLAAEEVNEVASRYLEDLAHEERRWFLFLFYFDTHNPYSPPEEDRLFEPEGYTREGRVGGAPRDPDGKPLKYRTAALREWFTPEDLRYLQSLYEGEVHHFDRAVRFLFEELERLGLRESTTVVISADHGEAFYERGFWGHGYLSRSEEERVPLIVVPPGESGRVVEAPVTTTDVFHSILNYFGAAPPFPTQPLPWVVDIMTGDSRGPVAYTEGPGTAFILRGKRYSFYRYLAIEDPLLPLTHPNGDFVFDLQTDPDEIRNLLEVAASEGESVRRALLSRAPFWPEEQTGPVAEPFEQGDDSIREQLRTLGYLP